MTIKDRLDRKAGSSKTRTLINSENIAMSEHKIRIPRAVDVEIIRFFTDVIKIIGATEFNVRIIGLNDIINFKENTPLDQLEIFKNSCSIQDANISKKSVPNNLY